MAILQATKLVPFIYPNESRDFQFLLRYYDYLINGIKYDIDQIKNVIDTETCNSKILYLLQSKVGFFSTATITDEELRYVLGAFPYIIRNKGSMRAVRQAVNVFCKINKINSGYRILYKNKVTNFTPATEEEDKFKDDTYVILIEIMSSFKDTTILDEIFKYILPPTYEVKYMFMASIKAPDIVMDFLSDVNYELLPNDYLNMEIYNSSDYFGQKYTNETINEGVTKVGDNPLRDRVETSIISNYDGERIYEHPDQEELQLVTENVDANNVHPFNRNQNSIITNYESSSEDEFGGNVETTILDT